LVQLHIAPQNPKTPLKIYLIMEDQKSTLSVTPVALKLSSRR